MEFDQLFVQHRERLADFWGRRRASPHVERTVQVFDRSVRFLSNDAGALAAIDECLPLYSLAPQAEQPPFTVQFVVQPGPQDPGPPPDDLFGRIQYTGEADWLAIQLGPWGHCQVDLGRGRAVAVLSPRLSLRPELIGRCLLNTVLTNFFIGSGYAMLHASCVYRDGRAVLLMADHNVGKSTTALRLALAGYPLLADSMVFLPPQPEPLALLGFPVGKIKVRRDMVSEFPQLGPWLVPEQVGGEIKYSMDLRRLDPALVYPQAAVPSAVDLCLLARSSGERTRVVPATEPEVLDAVLANSLYYDTPPVWRRNLALIERLLAQARWHHLLIGSEADRIVMAVGQLWARP